MPLSQKSYFETDATGATEVLSLAPVDAEQSFQVQIAGASYGNDTTDVMISADRRSLTIHVNQGMDSLVITVISPNQQDSALLVQDGKTVTTFELTDHWASDTLYIYGA